MVGHACAALFSCDALALAASHHFARPHPCAQWEMVKAKEKTPEHTHVLIDLGFVVRAMPGQRRLLLPSRGSCGLHLLCAAAGCWNPLCQADCRHATVHKQFSRLLLNHMC